MKFVIDRHIPFIEGRLEPFGRVEYLDPQDIDSRAVADADALIVRTRTKVGRDLLYDGKCRFVATATIGTDHIDTQWCADNGVGVYNAPGCNAPAVAQYVLSAIGHIFREDVAGKRIAVVGVGHVGSIVCRWAQSAGMTVLPIDPPRAAKEGGPGWATLAEAASEADIITFHTPLTKTGRDITYHLADREFFDSLRRKPVIINSSRGPVVDNDAWVEAIDRGLVGESVVDVWENEPDIDYGLLQRARIATPHIAGYSVEGKMRATKMVLDAVRSHFALDGVKDFEFSLPPTPDAISIADATAAYDPVADTLAMKMLTAVDDPVREFERLRDNYPLRHEIII